MTRRRSSTITPARQLVVRERCTVYVDGDAFYEHQPLDVDPAEAETLIEQGVAEYTESDAR